MQNNQEPKCLLCGASAELKHGEYPGYQKPMTFEIYHCKVCNTAFSMPKVEVNKLYENIYRNGDSVPGYDRYWKYAQIVKSQVNPLEYLSKTEDTYWGVREALIQIVLDKQSTKVLEIGSGLGYLTYSLRKADYIAFGLDISETAVIQAKKDFGDYYFCGNLFEYAQMNAESFDIVILTEVIEHIDAPISFIESILTLLKSNGRVIITTPNKSFYPLDIIWKSDLPPLHCWWFSEESMKYIAKKFNLNVGFVNFGRYYQENYRMCDIKKCRNSPPQKPTLDENGELIIGNNRRKNTLKLSLSLFMSRIPYIKKIYRKLRDFFNPNIVVCSDRGTVLCAILEKN